MEDNDVTELKNKLNNNELDSKQFCMIENTLCDKTKINEENIMQYFVPKISRLALLKEYHDGQAHIGVDKTFLSLAKHYWFPHMRKFCQKYIASCLTCLTRKRLPKITKTDVKSIEKVPIPFHTLHIDCLGPLPKTEDGNTHIFVLIDAFSKFCFLYAIADQTMTTIAEIIKDIIYTVGAPNRIIMDNGTSFKKLPECEELIDWNIDWHTITPYVHQANGQVERYMLFITNLLRVQVEADKEWDSLIHKTQLIINSTIHRTTGQTPLQTLFGCDGRLPEIARILNQASIDKLPTLPIRQEEWRDKIKKRLDDSALRQEKSAPGNKSLQQIYKTNDFVMVCRNVVKTKKLESAWTGPY